MAEIINNAHVESLEEARLYLGHWFNGHDSDSVRALNIAQRDMQTASSIIGKLVNELRREQIDSDVPFLQLEVGSVAIRLFTMRGQYYEDTYPAEDGELLAGETLGLHNEFGGRLEEVRGLWVGDYAHYVHTSQIAETLSMGGSLTIITESPDQPDSLPSE
jgi:hypothetical protein